MLFHILLMIHLILSIKKNLEKIPQACMSVRPQPYEKGWGYYQIQHTL